MSYVVSSREILSAQVNIDSLAIHWSDDYYNRRISDADKSLLGQMPRSEDREQD